MITFILGIFFSFGVVLNNKLLTQIFASTTWTQTDWSGGSGASTTNQYSAISTVDATGTSGQLTLAATSGWYNTSWKYRKKITFDNTTATLGATSEALSNFPVLVKLTSSNFDFSLAQSAGQDIRFTDSDGTTSLSYEIEKWDNSGQQAWVWVKVPSVDINSSTDNIYLYYGNSGASDAQAATSTWDSHYKMILHMRESGATVADSTTTALSGAKIDANNPALSSSGIIDGAQSFDGSDYIDVANGFTNTVQSDDTHTIEFWVKPNSGAMSGESIVYGTSHSGFVFDGQFKSGGGWYWGEGGAYRTYTGFTFTAGTWYHIVEVKTGAGNSGNLYINGALQSTYSGTLGTTPTTAATLRIGQYDANYFYNGIADEFRISNSALGAGYVAAEYKTQNDAFNTFAAQEERYSSSGTLTSNIYDSGVGGSYWDNLTYTANTSSGTAVVKVRSSNSATMSGATAFSSCNAITSGSDMSSNNCMTDGQRYVQYQISLTSSAASTPIFQDISIAFSPYDTTAPTTNASAITTSTASSGGRTVASNGWNSTTSPYSSWTAGADNGGGSGLEGYCLYLGTDSEGDPATAKGVLGTSPVSTTGSTCQFIVSSTTLDLSTSGYLGSALADGSTYYLNIKAIDNGNNIYAGSAASFHFRQDATAPTNVTSISTPGSSFSNVVDMYFSWPVSGGTAASDSHSGVLGYQYQINSTSGTWLGTSTDSTCSLNYIPAATSSYALTSLQDGSSISAGNNTVYFRAVDSACNTSSAATYRTGLLSYGGAAPTFGGGDTVTVTPSTNTSNSFAFSWPAGSPAGGRTITHYYYMINTSPPSTLSTITSNTATYINNATTRTVSAASVAGAIKGSNTVYVVAVDDQDNYSPSNVITGTFTLNSTLPDPPKNLAATDSSIKASSLWRVSLGWGTPDYAGTGSLTHIIQRSADGSSWATVDTTTGTSYIDTVPESKAYYWRVGTYDTSSDSENSPSYANAVTLTPEGTFTDAASLTSGPTVSGITTEEATISWSTSRESDSVVSFGTSSGSYSSVNASNTSQVTSHAITLANLTPGATYYYIVKWTDEDGNTGTSSEKTFTTDPPPSISAVTVTNIGLDSAVINFTISDASSAKIYYGVTSAFGGTQVVSTGATQSAYSVRLTGLSDGTKYYYKINGFDSDDTEYQNQTTLDFTTLPRPKISNVRVQQVANTAQSTILVSWSTNTEVSSIVTYYPEGDPSKAKDDVNVALIKGNHQMILRGLLPQTNYALIVKGRDKAGNEASSDAQKVTTATDTRPPQVSDLKVEGSTVPSANATSQESSAQFVVTWNTDEPASSQVEFGEGSGTNYSQKTQEDSNLTTNHLVVISGLTPSKVYHLKAVSKDKVGNPGNSVDSVNIAPKATDNAFNLVISNLSEVFGFLKGVAK